MNNFKWTKTLLTFATVVAGLSVIAPQAHAEQTQEEKAADNARETKTAVKKKGRRIKKKVRDATGNSSTKEDVKDAARNTGDSVSDKAKELKDKAD